MLAVLAKFHKIPFYIVTPTTSINKKILTGKDICIEERSAMEMICLNGKIKIKFIII